MSKKQHHHHQHQHQPAYHSGPTSPGEGSSSTFVPVVPGEFDSSPETERQEVDFNQFIYNEASPYLSFDEGTTSPLGGGESFVSSTYEPERPNPSTGSTGTGSRKGSSNTSLQQQQETEIARLNRRREQNRLSQTNYRLRKQQAYDDVVAQLEAEKHRVAELEAEVARLHELIAALGRDKQTSLEAVIRLCRSMIEAPPAASAGPRRRGGGGGVALDPSQGRGSTMR